MARSKCSGPNPWFLNDAMTEEVAQQAGLLKTREIEYTKNSK
jgi:hypothetical protein